MLVFPQKRVQNVLDFYLSVFEMVKIGTKHSFNQHSTALRVTATLEQTPCPSNPVSYSVFGASEESVRTLQQADVLPLM